MKSSSPVVLESVRPFLACLLTRVLMSAAAWAGQHVQSLCLCPCRHHLDCPTHSVDQAKLYQAKLCIAATAAYFPASYEASKGTSCNGHSLLLPACVLPTLQTGRVGYYRNPKPHPKKKGRTNPLPKSDIETLVSTSQRHITHH